MVLASIVPVEDPRLARRWLGVSVVDRLAATFALLADAVEEHLDTALLRTLAGV